jgi:hypothetical protein
VVAEVVRRQSCAQRSHGGGYLLWRVQSAVDSTPRSPEADSRWVPGYVREFGSDDIDIKRVPYPCCDDEVDQVGFLDHALALDVVCVEILAELGEGHVL